MLLFVVNEYVFYITENGVRQQDSFEKTRALQLLPIMEEQLSLSQQVSSNNKYLHIMFLWRI